MTNEHALELIKLFHQRAHRGELNEHEKIVYSSALSLFGPGPRDLATEIAALSAQELHDRFIRQQ